METSHLFGFFSPESISLKMELQGALELRWKWPEGKTGITALGGLERWQLAHK
jgi:hypothetical protein